LEIWKTKHLEIFVKNNIAMLEQPPYSPDLDPVTLYSSPNSREYWNKPIFRT